MENNKTHNDILAENILSKIKSGEIEMHSKIYFSLKFLLLIAIAFLTMVFSSLVASYILFSLRESGELFLLGYGFRGVLVFFILFPWKTLAVDLVLIIILEKLIKKFRFGYRSSLITLCCGIILFTLFMAFIIIITPIHQILLRRAEQRQLPVIGDLYAHLHRPPRSQGVFVGHVISISGNSFVIQHDNTDDDPDATTTAHIIAPPNLNIQSFINIGDTVYVAGTPTPDGIQAYGISKVSVSNTVNQDIQ